MFPDPLQAIAAFARVAHHASFKRCRIGSGAAGDIYSGDLVRVYVRLIYRRLGTFRQSDFDRLSSTRFGRSAKMYDGPLRNPKSPFARSRIKFALNVHYRENE